MPAVHIGLLLAAFAPLGGRAESPLALTPLLRVPQDQGGEILVVGSAERRTNVVAFRAVAGRFWPAGLVPVFAVESNGRFELRRLPPLGRENFTDPLFFALPLADEPEVARVAGRWSCISRGAEGNQNRLTFEFAVLGERIAGRFDQDTDYRFAFITGGTWRTNGLELAVEHINDRYALTGSWRDGRLTGEWQQLPDGDRGTWEATRPRAEGIVPPESGAVALYEWRRGPDGARRYLLESEKADPGWERTAQPLGRVWPP